MDFKPKPEEFKPIVKECLGCSRIVDEGLAPFPAEDGKTDTRRCSAYVNPMSKWRIGNCPLATHIITRVEQTGKKRIGQQKHKKM